MIVVVPVSNEKKFITPPREKRIWMSSFWGDGKVGLPCVRELTESLEAGIVRNSLRDIVPFFYVFLKKCAPAGTFHFSNERAPAGKMFSPLPRDKIRLPPNNQGDLDSNESRIRNRAR